MTELLNRNLLGMDPKAPSRFNDLAKETEGCILLTAGEPDFGISDVVKTNVTRALNNGLTHYAASNGDTRIRVAAADFEKRTKGMTYAADEVIMTTGSTEAVFLALLGILNPGDEVVIPVPAVNLYENVTKLAGAVPVLLDTTEDGYQISAEKLTAVLTDKTKAVVLNSPNNPTGVIYTQETLQAVHDAVAGKPIFVLCDDAYNRVVYDEAHGCPSFAGLFPDLKTQTLVAQSFSNSYAMAGFRLGYLLVTALAPKVSEDQQGLLYTAHDYAAHGRAADYVVLMTYEWGYTYGPPMAVAPKSTTNTNMMNTTTSMSTAAKRKPAGPQRAGRA